MTRKKTNTPKTITPPPSPVTQALSQGFEAKQDKVAKPSRSGETVTVGCKTPNGIVLRLQVEQEVRYPVMGGGFTVEKQWRADPSLPTYTLHGSRAPHGDQPRCLVVGGYAMTPGIPADFMARWMDQNKHLDLVTSGLIIVHRDTDSARDDAKDRRDVRSGLEPIRPGNDPRIPKRKARDGELVDAIETGDEQPKNKAA